MSDDIKALQFVIMEKDRIISDCNDSFEEYNKRIWRMEKTLDVMRLNVDHSRLDAYNDIKHKNYNLQCKIDNLEADNERLKRKQRSFWNRIKIILSEVPTVCLILVMIGLSIGMFIGCVV